MTYLSLGVLNAFYALLNDSFSYISIYQVYHYLIYLFFYLVTYMSCLVVTRSLVSRNQNPYLIKQIKLTINLNIATIAKAIRARHNSDNICIYP